MSYTNTTINIMDDETKETLVWQQMAVEVVYSHDNDNFQLHTQVDGKLEMLGEFDKSSEAVKAAQEWLERQKHAKKSETVYSFHQNNSGGYYCQPAKHIIVKDARDSEHAFEIAIAAGMYLGGVAAGSDCSCCGDRWYGMENEHDTIEEAIAYAKDGYSDNDGIPQYIIVDDLDVEDTMLE